MKRFFYLAFIALSLCACDNTEELLDEAPEIPKSPVVYHMSLQASLDAQTRGVTFDNTDESVISTQFESTDKVYVYNETKGAFARSAEGDHNLSYLTPTNISGTSCTLEGDLSFYKWDDSENAWVAVTVDAADTYSLYYQINNEYISGISDLPSFDWVEQDGSAAAASNCDFAEATGITMTLSDNTLTVPNSVCLNNLQSMFRQHLSFTKGGVEVTTMPTIKKLTVGIAKNKWLLGYRPNNSNQYNVYQTSKALDIYDPVITDGDIYLSLAFYYTGEEPAPDDQLILTAFDDEGNVYEGIKGVPEGGFQKSKYYYGSCELEWKDQMVKPTVTCSVGGDEDELEPDADGWYLIYPNDDNDPLNITISGDSKGYRFCLNDVPAVVTLTGSGNPVSAIWSDQSAFIESDDDLTIVLDCNYVIDNSAKYSKAIECGGNLKLKTTGGTKTLTVITNDNGSFAYGIYGDSNWDAWMIDFDDIAKLAAEGFTVTLSDDSPLDNEDGTYTWVYTIAPIENKQQYESKSW